jgi:hypothetical protein
LSALVHPKLFSSLILIDPIIVRPIGFPEDGTRMNVREMRKGFKKKTVRETPMPLILGALGRKNKWTSRLAPFFPFYSLIN